ncbi:RHS repeat-associated core domain-containing protein [Dyella sp. GSA-30]|uniref:RHS repeat-associated core domain-containing protein n=1 Tax=Dyella sp. GSA-30 TaxID=2994496 RepID=UPI0024908F4A|nr:RHS repeat-associated core domain-containing protein [Dyella sp. GSA-30]
MMKSRWPRWSLWLVLVMLQLAVCAFPGAAQAQTYGPPFTLNELDGNGTGSQSPGPYFTLQAAMQAAANVLNAEYGTGTGSCFIDPVYFGAHPPSPYVARQAYGGNDGGGSGSCFFDHDEILIVGTPQAYDVGKNAGGCNCNSGDGGKGAASSPKKSSGDSAIDSTGGASGTPMAGDPINTATGNKYEQDTDFRGSSWLTFRRFYNSGAGVAGAIAQTNLGPQWRHSFDRSLAIFLSNPGASDDSLIVLYRPDGSSEQFLKSGGVWHADADIADTLTEQDDASGNPVSYTVFMASVREYEQYSAAGLLQSITDQTGQTALLAYSTASTPTSVAPVPNLLLTVSDPSGRQLNFSYNSNGSLSQVALPDGGTLLYGYDATTGNLTSVQYPDGKVLQYVYNEASLNSGTSQPTALTGVIDEAGVRFASTGYNSQGQAISSTFAGGADAMAVTYSVNPGPATLTTPLGLSVHLQAQTDASGSFRSAASSVPCGTQCNQPWKSLSYDSHGYTSSRTDFNGNITNTTYDSTGLLDQEVDAYNTPNQRTITTTWNTSLRLPLTRVVRDNAGNTVASSAWVYNAIGQTLAHCEADPTNAAATGYQCSNTGNVPAGVRRWTYTYCASVDAVQCPLVGLLLTATGPRTDVNDTTTYAYFMDDNVLHRHGDLSSVTDALGHHTTYIGYDGAGRLTTMADQNGIISTMSYTPRGWLASWSTGFDFATTNYTYTPYGAVETMTDPDGIVTTYSYNNAHRLTKVTDGQGNYIQYTLDASGNRTAENIYSSSGATPVHSLSRQFNTLGQLVKAKDGLSHTVFDASAGGSYDANGNLVLSSDGFGIQKKSTLDALDRLASTIENYNGSDVSTQNTTTAISYDALDRITQVIDPSNLATHYSYDGLDNRTGLQSPDTGSSTDTFDAAGNRLTHTDAKGVVSTSTYDALNRLLTVSFADTTLNVTYHYDELNSVTGCSGAGPVGRLTRVVENAVTTTYCYDDRGNVVQKFQAQGSSTDTTSYGYTLANRLNQVTYPSGSVAKYGRNILGQIASVTVTPSGGAGQAVVSNVTYLPFGPVVGYTLGNGQAVTRNYDENYRLLDLASPSFSLHFTRDVMGSIASLGNTPGAPTPTETYTYDPFYRLTGVLDSQGNAVESYTYNKTGDRLSKTSTGGLAAGTYSYQSGTHWLTSIGSSARSYDLNGNTTGNATGGQTFGFGYDGRNRLTVAQANNVTVGTYTYNASGERIAKMATTPQAFNERFAYDETSRLIGEYGSSNRDYVWMDDLPIAAVDGLGSTASVNFVVADGAGTPRSISDASGTLIWQWPYQSNPFGEKQPVSANGYALNLRYPGQYFDQERGVAYNVNRDYDAATGRYLQSDPVGLAGGMSSYAYVNGAPLGLTDPQGLEARTAPVKEPSTTTQRPPTGRVPSFGDPANDPVVDPEDPELGFGVVIEACAANPVLCGIGLSVWPSTAGGPNDEAPPGRSNVIPFPVNRRKPPPQTCPGDNGCEQERQALMLLYAKKLALLVFFGKDVEAQVQRGITASYNKLAKDHNQRCPSFQVPLIDWEVPPPHVKP